MIINVVSAFRNMEERCSKYFQQVNALRDVLNMGSSEAVMVRCIACEGDSLDRTKAAIVKAANAFSLPTTLLEHDHGGADWGSTEAADRLAKLSGVLNAALDGVQPEADFVLYVESDLYWDAYDMKDLVDLVTQDLGFDIIAPLVMAGLNFYDVWGHRGTDDERFGPMPPYHSSLRGIDEGVVQVNSAGSCLAMRGEVAREVRCQNEGALVGWCLQARDQGYRIGVAPHIRINHPA